MAANSRREFLLSAGSLLAWLIGHASNATAQHVRPSPTRLILLGTGGGPRPRTNSFPTSQVIVIDGLAYVVDCGDGVALQLVRAGIALPTVRHVLITHHHSDHNADYGNLLLLAWVSGLRTRLDCWGPPPLDRMTRLFFEMNAEDIQARISDEARIALVPLIHVHELTGAGPVLQNESVRVTCALVDHPPMRQAFAYRFDAHDRSIVISGDTRSSEALVRLAHGADVLVHEVYYPPAVDRLASRVQNAPALKASITGHHTSVQDAGRVAAEAGVKVLVLSHFVPPDDPDVSDQMWIDAARSTFTGRVIVGKDLLEI